MSDNPFVGMTDKDFVVFKVVLTDAVAAGINRANDLPCSQNCPRMATLVWWTRSAVAIAATTLFGAVAVHFIH